jgi:hypothetical protein
MTDDNLDSYREANYTLYDETAQKYANAVYQAKHQPLYQMRTRFRNAVKQHKEEMKLLDFRLKGLGEE